MILSEPSRSDHEPHNDTGSTGMIEHTGTELNHFVIDRTAIHHQDRRATAFRASVTRKSYAFPNPHTIHKTAVS